MTKTYTFTNEQLTKLLYETIDMFNEYVRKYDENGAKLLTVNEMFNGLNAEQDLVDDGIVEQAVGQVYSAPPTPKEPEHIPGWIEELIKDE